MAKNLLFVLFHQQNYQVFATSSQKSNRCVKD